MERSSGLEKPVSDPVSGANINDDEVGASAAAAAAVTEAEEVAQVKLQE